LFRNGKGGCRLSFVFYVMHEELGDRRYVSNDRFFGDVYISIDSPFHIAAHRLILIDIDFVVNKLVAF
jgi:hypothetical protein